MSVDVKSLLISRSRAPLNDAGVELWNKFCGKKVNDETKDSKSVTTKFKDKSTSTNAELDPKDIVLKKWREDQSKKRFDETKRAITESIKRKFESQEHKVTKNDISGNADVEDTSNPSARVQGNTDLRVEGREVEMVCAGGYSLGHASWSRAGAALGVAQSELAARGSRAAGVEGGLRGRADNMPLASREGLVTPRSARAPVGRKPSALIQQRLKKEKSLDSPPEMNSPLGSTSSDLQRQNEELRARLAGENADHKRRLEAYRRAQQGQAALVSRLQAKVLQYKQRCTELENQMLETTPRSEPSYRPSQASKAIALPAPAALPTPSTDRRDDRINDLETALRRLDEEKRRCEKLVAQNNLLRDQLEESHQLNEALTNDLQKLTNDWEALRDEMTMKEDEWKDEEQAFNDYYSNEHTRLLSLWREVVSVKRFFNELQSSTERDLYKTKSDIDSATRELVGALSGYAINAYAAQGPKVESQSSGNTALEGLRVELHNVTSQRDTAVTELRERDARIQRLLGELQELEERCECAEVGSSEANIMRGALEEVARALIHDAGSDAPVALSSDRSPKRGMPSSANATAFAESTISAVQAALHKYQIQIHELQVKHQNTKEQLMTTRKHSEIADNTIATLEGKIQDLQGKLDQSIADLNQLTQEKESMQKTIESLRVDKNNLERNRVEINAMVESLTSDYEKLQKINNRLDKTIESLEAEKRNLVSEVDRLHREASDRESVLRSEEERSARMRAELVSAREDLHRTELARDLLQQQRDELDALLASTEKTRNELEIDLERTLLERGDLQDLADKLQAAVRNLECDKKKLQEDIKHLEDEKSSLSGQSSEQLSDLNSLRKELLAAEQNRIELEADKAALYEKIKSLEGEREKVEMELRQVVRERGELSSQLSALARKRDALQEENVRLSQRLEQAGETVARLNRTIDDHVKHGEERQMCIDNLERDKQHLSEGLAALRAEKEALEAALFDTSSLLEDTDARRARLEQDLQEALVLQENFKGQITRLSKELESSEKKLRETKASMTQQSGKKEAEYKQLIANLNRTTADNITKLKEEKEQLRQALEQKLNQTIAALTSEKEAVESGARERERRLTAARDQLMLQHDEALLRAENDKQQALLMAHQEQQALCERLEEERRILAAERGKLERTRRDAAARADADRAAIAALKDELATAKTRLDEAKAAAEDECARLETRIKELHLEKEALHREGQEARAQLALAEDKYDAAHAQLQDTLRKLKEVENEAEGLRKDLADTRRTLSSATAERDKYNSACRELREHVKRAETERREAARARDDAYHKIVGLEESRSTLEGELSRLAAALKAAEGGGEHATRALRAAEAQLQRERAALQQANHDIKELQSRLQNESEERERVAGEAGTARRHGAELEGMLACARADLAAVRQRAADLEDACRQRDQELVLRLEDCRSKERRLEELKHNLEVCLADATQQIQELKTRLGASEGRGRATEAALASAEAGRRDAELRLSAVAAALRRVCGVQPDGSVLPAARRRLASPVRRYSPHRGKGRDHSEDRNEIIDVDPELIKKGIRNLMHEVCQIEREKDDFKAQVGVLKKQLKEASAAQGAGVGKLQELSGNVRGLSDERAKLQAALAQRDVQLAAINESVQTKTIEISNLRDRITSLEATLTSITEEKTQNENKSGNLRAQLAERVQEVGQLREALAAVEARASRLDVRRAQLEGDVQRAAAAARDRDAALQKLQERCEGHTRTIASLEDRCTSLKGTVEQLSGALQKAAAAETELRAELSRVTRQLTEARNNEANATDKLRQIQKNVANCENERRVLSEKLESAKAALGEAKRVNCSLDDQVHRLTNQLANVEAQRADLECQLRMASWDSKDGGDGELERELRALQREREELRAQNDMLLRADRERRVRPRAHSTDRTLHCADRDSGDSLIDNCKYKETPCKDKFYDKSYDKSYEKSFGADIALLEIENRELKMKIRRLEKEIADKESEISLLRTRFLSEGGGGRDAEQYRAAALQAERLLEARESSHRQQIARLENQLSATRASLAAEVRRRQAYVARSGRAARDVQRLRTALGDSLRTVSQDPALDSYTLEHEARKLDSTLAHSLPPLNDSFDSK